MAILKFKKLLEDLENNTSQVIGSVTKTLSGNATYATSSAYSGTAYKATSAGQAGTAYKATTAGRAGTAYTTSTNV